MPKYEFVGKLPNGRPVRGTMFANSLDQATFKLRKRGIAVSNLITKEGGGATFGGRVSAKDIVLFTRQFSVMQEAGMGLVDTFEILSRQSQNPKLIFLINSLKNSIKEGSSLADALEKFPKYFNELYVSMIRAGEMAGSLADVFLRLAGYLEKSQKLAGQIKTAMVYPTIVLTVAFGIIWGLLVFVVPIFQKVFENTKGGLPLPTQILVNTSDFVRDNVIITIIGLIVMIIIGKMIIQTPGGRYQFHRMLLKVPLIGNIIHKVSISRFTTTLGSLIQSGVPIVDGLELSGKSCGNLIITEGVRKVSIDVVEGKPLAFSMEKTGLFPPMVINMVRVGEETGSLEKMLQKVNVFYEEEVDASIKGLTAAIEPLMIVGLGSIIAAFVIAMYLPIFQMATAME